ncbi:bifunctional phosphatase PAP2/O-acyltransferase family protein [Nocardia africana]|uniref:bifunctional phosphatase PAP2/O-acyltransferase family protein n=1 Tax=Nocardia africana TaxID=134964 RepID=UPI0007A547C0|nr:phosphatase PAP2 family protein [Nocardia africana]MCC3316954.1 phosphatase PAP2 family protein [Nocardia africana]
MGNPSRPVLWRDCVVGLAVFGLYLAVDALHTPARRESADRNAHRIVDLEQWLAIDVERPLNRWLESRALLATLANYEYAFTYIISAFALLFWLYFRRRAEYARARDSFLLLNVLAIACFAFFPVTPPRLLPELHFTDTVVDGHTWGSWGSSLVSGANQLAAVPSLHVGWALWVSVVLARVSGGWAVQMLSAFHVGLTTYVIVATANHFILDAVIAVAFVAVSIQSVDRWYARPPVVPPADAFFLHIEKSGIPQQVGGMVVFRPRADGGPGLAAVRELVQGELAHLPRFQQRLDQPGRWRRARWVDSPVDWDWHVTERTIAGSSSDAVGDPGRRGAGLAADGDREYPDGPATFSAVLTTGVAVGPAAGTGESAAVESRGPATAEATMTPSAVARRVDGISRVVTDLAAEVLPKDRPLWRLVLVRDPEAGAIGVVLLLHHVVADGIGTVVQALRLLRPTIDLPVAEREPPSWGTAVAGTAAGLAQLAADAQPRGTLPDDCLRRVFTVCSLDLETVRAVARSHRARVTDVLLSVTVTALQRLRPDLGERLGGQIRVAVPLMVRDPTSGAEGNSTAAVMIDIPLTAATPAQRLAEIRTRSDRLHSGTRALASHFVMDRVLRVFPEPAVGAFARSVYGGRFFHAIVSNMAGPDLAMTFANMPITQVFPILPSAPGVPLVAGVLSWNGDVGIGLSVDPAILEARAVAAELPDVLAELADTTFVSDKRP